MPITLNAQQRSPRARQIARVLCSVVAGLLLARSATSAAPGAEVEPPYGLNERVPWTTSRLVGSPNPPLPYTVERTFTGIKWQAPIYAIEAPGTDALWIVSAGGGQGQPSRLLRVKNDPQATQAETILELPGRLLYSVCPDPAYAQSHEIYVFTNGPTGNPVRNDRVARYRVSAAGNRQVEPASEEVVLEWPSAGHDGGDMAFGSDGLLYIATGDGSADSDQLNSGQTLDDLLGAILRIDVRRTDDGRPYRVPADNPFVGREGARGEIWAYGLRNPWRMSFDQTSGQLWVGNNGQDRWETAHLVRKGENYGWSIFEGSHAFYLERQRGPTPPVAPTIEHSHADFRSLTGGVVYHGPQHTDLEGAYIYGDYSSGRIWGLKHDGQGAQWHRELADTSLQIAGFCCDRHGQLLVVDHGGGLYRLVAAPPAAQQAPFPRLLSETGLFTSTEQQAPAPGLIPYTVNWPAWNDGAWADRWLAVPGEAKVDYDAARGWTFPDGTAIVQTLSLDAGPDNTAARRRLETRVLLKQQGEWAGYSYAWNKEQTDAELVESSGAELALPPGGPPGPWRVPSRAECMACHSRAANYVLGVSEAQLNGPQNYAGGMDNQLRTLDHVGLFSKPLEKPLQECAKLPTADDASAPLEQRARAYLHVNCSGCHVAAGGGNAQMELLFTQPLDKTNLVGARPQHDTFGIANAMLVAPGNPQQSVLLRRLGRRGPGQMPPLVSRQVDESAVALLSSWIEMLKPARPIVRRWQVADLADDVAAAPEPALVALGKQAFRETGCVQCHRFGGEGGSVGPDLTSLARQAPREVLESIIEPSKVIAEAYANYVFQTDDGETFTGRIEQEDAEHLVVRLPTMPEAPRTLPATSVVARKRSDVSNMPAGTIDVLSREEILGLIAYLRGGASGEPAAKP